MGDNHSRDLPKRLWLCTYFAVTSESVPQETFREYGKLLVTTKSGTPERNRGTATLRSAKFLITATEYLSVRQVCNEWSRDESLRKGNEKDEEGT